MFPYLWRRLPNFTPYNQINCCEVDFEDFCDFFERETFGSHFSNEQDFVVGELGGRVRFSREGSTGVHHISHVVRMRPKFQMIRVAAFRIVAHVSDNLPIQNLSLRQLIGGAVCRYFFTFVQLALPVALRNVAVAIA